MSQILSIKHDPKACCFYGSEQPEARLEYEWLADRQAVNFYRTYVPHALRGQGLAGQLLQTAMAWAEQQQVEVLASCSYVERYLASQRQQQS